MSPSVHDVLVEARRLIRKGWCKHFLVSRRDGKVKYCVLGALADASRHHPEKSYDLLSDMILSDQSLVDWNNAPERKKSDVLALLDKAIKETTK